MRRRLYEELVDSENCINLIQITVVFIPSALKKCIVLYIVRHTKGFRHVRFSPRTLILSTVP
jgi:hypothetical protein